MSELRWDEIARDPFSGLRNPETEQSLLGAILINNNVFEHVSDIIVPDDFSFPVHGRIFAAVGALLAEGKPATPATLRNFFDRQEKELDGGVAYLGKLAAAAAAPSLSRGYAEVIADLARRRDVITAAQEIVIDAAIVDPERPAATVIDEAEEKLFSIADRKERSAGPMRLGEIITKTIGDIEAAYKAGGAVTIDTGLLDLDRVLCGMGAGDLYVLAARPGMGKTALAGTIALNAARRRKSILMFSLEMSKAQLAQRWLAGMTGVPTDRQRHGKLDAGEWSAMADAQAQLAKLPILVDDQPRLSVQQMRQRARRVRRRHGLDLIIVDHLQLVRQGGRQESRRLEIGDASGMLKAISKELGVPVLLLSQLSRAPEQRDNKRPQLSDLRESGDIEQDADVVMFLYRDEYYIDREQPKRRPTETSEGLASRVADWEQRRADCRGIAEIHVAKNRHGQVDTVKVRFDAPRQCFENLETRW